MRWQSAKRAAQARRFGPIRKEFVQTFRFCVCCGHTKDLCCHEIVCGNSFRAAAETERAAWLAVCDDCNKYQLTDYSIWPIERQLAVKWIFDKQYFDLDKICTLRGRVPGCIEMWEVIPHICRQLDGVLSWD
jgi:hypothetical protein